MKLGGQSSRNPGAELTGKKARALAILRALKRLFPNPRMQLNYSNNWELLVAVVLSAQCTDKKVNEVTAALFQKYRKLDDYLKAGPREFEKDIKPTGFYHSKAKNILAAAKVVKKEFGGSLPKTMDEMLTIPGVGRKTANVVLWNAYGVISGIAVDTHVRRLSRLLGLTKQTDPDKIEKDLEELIPKKEWPYITYALIQYGREYCPARSHNHATCPLSKIK
ncbi:MAG: endonuclease III [Patescibacteria group bacterium]|nr:endonuclease III [Patescibacteria group bacterium]